MAAGAAVILMKERQVVEAFERVGAVTSERAVSAQQLDIDEQGVGWRRLRRAAILRESAPGRYYLDVEVWQATRRRRRSVIAVVLGLALLIALVLGVLGIGRSFQ